jgi:type II secretory pathway pseudopilin PulG
MRKFLFGFSLVETIVFISLFSILFLGILGSYLFLFRVIDLQAKKATAAEICQGEMEKIKNLSYSDIGTIGASLPYARGILPNSETVTLNNIPYQIERKVKYIFDPTDNDEDCYLDYKKVEVKVSFSGRTTGEVTLTTDISPKDKIEEVQSCLQQPAGILRVQVLNSSGELVLSPTIEIFNPENGNLVDAATPSDGKYDFPLSPRDYRIVVSKPGYSKERTYSISEIAIPEKPNPSVIESQINQISFSIDRVSSILVKSFTNFSYGFFSDSFEDESKISQKTNVSVEGGEIKLSSSTEGYLESGNVFSVEISPQDLIGWEEFSFEDSEPENTDLKYQVYYFSNNQWVLIPDNDLPGNSQGFDQSPVDLRNLSPQVYSKIKLRANFSTLSSSTTPVLYWWQVSFKTSTPTPLSNVMFSMRGEKIIGKDSEENLVYKFSTTTQTNNQGEIIINDLEWDFYHFYDFQKGGEFLTISTSTPSTPLSLAPGTSTQISFFLKSQNSLILNLQDSQSLNPIFSATATLSNGNFSKVEYTDIKGQALFIVPSAGNFNLSVEAEGYFATSTTVYISRNTTKTVRLLAAE